MRMSLPKPPLIVSSGEIVVAAEAGDDVAEIARQELAGRSLQRVDDVVTRGAVDGEAAAVEAKDADADAVVAESSDEQKVFPPITTMLNDDACASGRSN